MNNNNFYSFKSAKGIAFLGVMTALVYVVLYLETFVFSAILPISPCFLSLPLAISLSIFFNHKTMFIGGGILGCCSFILALIFPQFAVFLNPLISILPRLMIGVVAYFVMLFIKKLLKNAKSENLKTILPDCVAGIFGALTNTVLVVTMMFLFKFTGLEDAFATIISFNVLAELVCSAVFVPILARTIRKFLKITKRAEG